jgi:ATP/maltotriose-dependent transcriptional regulator MalT
MLAESRKLAQKMERERVPWVDALARSVRASIALAAGDRDEALRLLGEAEPLLEAHHLEAILAVVRLQRGKMLGGDAGREAVDLGQAWMTAQRVHPSVARVLLAGASDSAGISSSA